VRFSALGSIVKDARYTAPTVPGLGAISTALSCCCLCFHARFGVFRAHRLLESAAGCDMLASSLDEFEYPNGSYWTSGVGLERAKLAFQ